MSERQTPQSHSRVKPITNKNTFPHSDKKDGGKVSTNATANDSQAVVNFNRQQRLNQQNSTSYNSSFSKGDKTEQQYYSQPKSYKYKNNSNQVTYCVYGRFIDFLIRLVIVCMGILEKILLR